jgi:excinuclease ABC subunit C
VLELDEPPRRIECFDISNTHGTDSVASLVVWEGARPKKSEYRSFNVKSVAGADDTASIAEAVERRYRRRVAENRRLPDLVVIDGGKGQLGAAVAALAQVGLPMLPVVGLAKREEEIFRPGTAEPLRLDRRSPALQLMQRVRDEAHRFAVGRHRRRRSRRTLKTELTEIPGIGPVRARRLLKEFGSLEGVKAAGEEALQAAVGKSAARAIRERYSR